MSKRILVLGANGQLGSELKAVAPNYPYRCFFTNRTELNIQNTTHIAQFVQANQIDTIINAAAYTQVDAAETDPQTAEAINAKSAGNLGTLCKHSNLALIHLSTDYVFNGNATQKPYKEDDPTNPQTIYGQTKLKGEQDIQNLNLPHSAILRTSWLFSPYGNNFVKTMLKLGKEKRSIDVVADQFGRPTHAKDLATLIFDILPKLKSEDTQIYHFANTGETSWYEFAKEIISLAQLNCIINPIPTSDYPTPAKRPAYSVLNTEKIERTFNISIAKWQDRLNACIRSIQNKKA